MTEAPERILAIKLAGASRVTFLGGDTSPPFDATEYVRADKVQALVDAAKVLEAVFYSEITRTGGAPFSGTWSIPKMGVRTTCDGALNDLDAALAAFTDGGDAGMSKLDALKELAAKVDAGTCPSIDLCVTALAEWSSLAMASFDGSLDAAKALHEAVLPGWDWSRASSGFFTVMLWRDDKVISSAGAGHPDNPARAWLLAVLRAMIAQEETQ